VIHVVKYISNLTKEHEEKGKCDASQNGGNCSRNHVYAFVIVGKAQD
jgi:hypothetical protein